MPRPRASGSIVEALEGVSVEGPPTASSDQVKQYRPPLRGFCSVSLPTVLSRASILCYGTRQGLRRSRGQGAMPDARCNLIRMPLYASLPGDHVEPTPPSCWIFDLLGVLADQATTGIILMDDLTDADKAQSQELPSKRTQGPFEILLLSCFISPSAQTRANNSYCRDLPFGHGQDPFKHLRGRSSAHCCRDPMCLAGSLPIASSPGIPAIRGPVPLSSHLSNHPQWYMVASSGSPGL